MIVEGRKSAIFKSPKKVLIPVTPYFSIKKSININFFVKLNRSIHNFTFTRFIQAFGFATLQLMFFEKSLGVTFLSTAAYFWCFLNTKESRCLNCFFLVWCFHWWRMSFFLVHPHQINWKKWLGTNWTFVWLIIVRIVKILTMSLNVDSRSEGIAKRNGN